MSKNGEIARICHACLNSFTWVYNLPGRGPPQTFHEPFSAGTPEDPRYRRGRTSINKNVKHHYSNYCLTFRIFGGLGRPSTPSSGTRLNSRRYHVWPNLLVGYHCGGIASALTTHLLPWSSTVCVPHRSSSKQKVKFRGGGRQADPAAPPTDCN